MWGNSSGRLQGISKQRTEMQASVCMAYWFSNGALA